MSAAVLGWLCFLAVVILAIAYRMMRDGRDAQDAEWASPEAQARYEADREATRVRIAAERASNREALESLISGIGALLSWLAKAAFVVFVGWVAITACAEWWSGREARARTEREDEVRAQARIFAEEAFKVIDAREEAKTKERASAAMAKTAKSRNVQLIVTVKDGRWWTILADPELIKGAVTKGLKVADVPMLKPDGEPVAVRAALLDEALGKGWALDPDAD